MVPVLNLEGVKLGYVHVVGLPGGLVVGQLSPLDQVVHVVLPVHTGNTAERRGKGHFVGFLDPLNTQNPPINTFDLMKIL